MHGNDVHVGQQMEEGMRSRYLVLALALALVPAAASAQQDQGMGMRARWNGRGMGMGWGNPAEMVLRHQADLNLTPSQLEKLGKIRDKFQHENREALASAEKERAEMIKKYGPGPYTDEQREQMRKDRGERRADFAKLSENRRKAMGEIREVLTPDQQSRLMAEMRTERERNENREAPGR